MPSFSEIVSSWSFEPVAMAVVLVLGVAYIIGAIKVRAQGHRWPLLLTIYFFSAGLGSFSFVAFGFLGTYSFDLRWAFTTKIALLLFVVPSGLALGRPLTLALLATTGKSRARLKWLIGTWPVRLMSNAVFATLFALFFFLLFITPLGGSMRQSSTWQGFITVVTPLVGLFMILPMDVRRHKQATLFMTFELLIAFATLVLDAIPGILIRINEKVLDGVGQLGGLQPPWFPNPLRDQQLSGDILWVIAEVADVPILIILILRWRRSDRGDAKALDQLSDEQMDELMRQHLRQPPQS
jgi:cytochrome c oxidase assembly factor CtaG